MYTKGLTQRIADLTPVHCGNDSRGCSDGTVFGLYCRGGNRLSILGWTNFAVSAPLTSCVLKVKQVATLKRIGDLLTCDWPASAYTADNGLNTTREFY